MQGPTRKPHLPSFRKPPCTSYFMTNFFPESTIDRDGNPREFFKIIDFQNESTVYDRDTEYFNEAAK
jgi:hypothetical protein